MSPGMFDDLGVFINIALVCVGIVVAAILVGVGFGLWRLVAWMI